MPHEGQAYRWSDSVRERFYNIHEAADSVTMLATQFTDECYLEADEFMMKRSVIRITVTIGSTATPRTSHYMTI